MAKRRQDSDDPYGLRGRMRRKPAHESIPEAIAALENRGVPRAQALHAVLTAADRFGRRPGGKALAQEALSSFFVGAAHDLVLDPDTMVGILYSLHRWHRSEVRAGALAAAIVGPRFARGDYLQDDGDPVLVRALELAVGLLDSAEHEGIRLETRSQLAASLDKTGDFTQRHRARDVLEEIVLRLEELTCAATDDEERHNWQDFLSRMRANLAQSITSLAEQNPRPWRKDLEHALQLHDLALADERRVAHTIRHYHSRRMRAGTRRVLALACIDERDLALGLAEGAVEDLDQAIAISKAHPEVRPIDGLGIYLNHVNARVARLRILLHHGELDQDQLNSERAALQDELESLCRRTRNEVVERLARQAILALPRRIRGDRAPDQALLEVAIRRAWEEVMHGSGTSYAAAASLLDELMAFAQSTESIPELSWRPLSTIFGHLDPDVVSLQLMRDLAPVEITLLARWFEGTTPEDAERYLDQALEDLERRMEDPMATSVERELFGGWMQRLAILALARAKPECTTDWLTLQDRLGSSGFRALSAIYGVGSVGDWKRDDEANWRTNLYRAYWERDFAGWVLRQLRRHEEWVREGAAPWSPETMERLFSHAQVLSGDMDEATVAELAGGGRYARSVDGWVIWKVMDEDAALRALQDTKVEVGHRLRYGAMRGWFDDPSAPRVSAEEVESFLGANPDIAILVAARGLHLVMGTQRISLPAVHSDRILELITSYAEARANYSWGPVDSDNPRGGGQPPERAALEEVLGELLDELGGMVQSLLVQLDREPAQLIVLARHAMREVPWTALSVGGVSLGARIPVTCVETLAAIPIAPANTGEVVGIIGGSESASPALGALVRTLEPQLDAPLVRPGREAIERAVERAAEVHILAHGQVIVDAPGASGLVLDEDHDEPQNRLSNSEIRQMDLRGVQRVGLWACNGAKSGRVAFDDLDADEPAGIDSAFLLAGAHRVVGALWLQYGMSTAMIAADVIARWRAEPERSDAAVLAETIEGYRMAVAEGGVVSDTIRAELNRPSSTVDAALAAGLDAWLEWRGLPTAEGAAPTLGALGRVVENAPRRDADGILSLLRSPLAWAGWRITVRSLEVLCPSRPA